MTLTLSPSKLEKFDETTPFGCRRAWWYEHASAGPKIKSPQTPAMMIGDGLHKEIEDYLKSGGKPYPNPSRLFMSGQHIIRDIMSEGFGPIEQWIMFELGGVPFKGRMDLMLGTRPISGKSRGVLDWKTTSDIEKYAKTESQLRTNHQMVLYAGHLVSHELADSPVAIEHVYFQTKGKETALRVQSSITGKQIKEHIEKSVLPLVAAIKLADVEPDVSKIKPSLSKCFRCPHASICPKGGVPVASFMDRFRQVKAGTPAPVAPTVPAPILPPDAPKSDPAKAADPVPGFTVPTAPAAPVTNGARKLRYPPVADVLASDAAGEENAMTDRVITAETPVVQPSAVEAASKRRGRPPGAVNKPKAEAPAQEPLAPQKPTLNPQRTFEVVEVSFSQGVTINLGDFQSARFDVGMKATCAPDAVDAAMFELRKLVFFQLDDASSQVMKK